MKIRGLKDKPIKNIKFTQTPMRVKSMNKKTKGTNNRNKSKSINSYKNFQQYFRNR